MLLEHLYAQLAPSYTARDYWVAYSGGLDSHVLLHAMAQLRQRISGLSLQAIHIHHGLSSHADHWAAHCRVVCADLDLNYHCEYIQGSPLRGDSVEAWAREARYAVFARMLTAGGVLLTAHTQDDQAETTLLQLLRGSGPKGLAAMPKRQALAQGEICRPLLNVTRLQLQQYAEQQSLCWIEDQSNADQRFDRNFLRHRIMPVLRERWPQAGHNMARAASHCASAAVGLAELAQQDLGEFGRASLLPIALLRALTPERCSNALRYWLTSLGCRAPNTRHIYRIQEDLINGREDSQPQVSWGDWTIRRYQQNLMVLPTHRQRDVYNPIRWDLATPLQLPDHLGQLTAIKMIDGGLSFALDANRLTIRFRQGGERCQPVGKAYTSPLKKLLQEWQVPPWQRYLIPLLYHEDELAAVIGYCICARFAAARGEMSWRLGFSLAIPGMYVDEGMRNRKMKWAAG